jgi:glycosyltransferase involved in cell wall biosynthesis
MSFLSRLFGRPARLLSISYGITVCNEAQELRNLLAALLPSIDAEDEVIVLRDVTRPADEVTQVLAEYAGRVRVIESCLDGDFATFKNRLFAAAKGDYLFQIDADEVPTPSLLSQLKPYLRRNRFIDCFRVPRINLIHGVTPAHIAQWGWKIDANGYVNFPDHQPRIARNNGRIRWKNKVHEKFTGYRIRKKLPYEDTTYCLLHVKTVGRQEEQNRMYDTLGE